MRPAVFLDRDGTMVHDVGYLSRREDLRWFPWTIDAIRLLNRAGLAVCVTTNQGGIGLGLTTDAFVRAIHVEMGETIRLAGGLVDAWYYCPHHPRAVTDELRIACACRKPGTGMIEQAIGDLDLDVARSFVIGDKMADVGLGQAAGATSVLVRTGHGEAVVRRHGDHVPGAARVVPTLLEAVSWILNGSSGS
ncbi:MAG TPA: HAD family hydrolase [Vicinamibacterales bacterium]|nr:HAD family hydrolase [Vicinamibacterales bacterium]